MLGVIEVCWGWLRCVGGGRNQTGHASTSMCVVCMNCMYKLANIPHTQHTRATTTHTCIPHPGLQSQHTKLQLASLNVACCVLAQLTPTPTPTAAHPTMEDPLALGPLQEALYADGAFGGALWPLLVHDSPAVRGKAAAAVVLMGRGHVTWWVETCSSKVGGWVRRYSCVYWGLRGESE